MTANTMLADCRVLDLADEKGWFCAKLLAGMGASVIQVCPPGRSPQPVYPNGGQRCLTLDIEKPSGRDLFLKLAAQSDVIVESCSPGYLPSLGLDYAALSQIHPGLIMASISPFGQAGTNSPRKASELTASASGGQLFLNGDPAKEPLKLYGTQPYLLAALFAANGILLALRRRRAGGPGQHIDISIQECVAGALDHALARYFSLGQIAHRPGKLYWNNSYRLFGCRDGWIGLSFLGHWQTLVEWLDSEGLAADLKEARWQDPAQREKNLPHIITVLEKWTLTHTVGELVEMGQLMGLPWAGVSRLRDILTSPQLRARGYFVETLDESGQPYQIPGGPVKMNGSPWRVHTHFPQPGEHNAEILGGLLGLSSSQIEKLESEGVI